MRMKGFPLPEVINTQGTRDICLTAPDDPVYLAALWGHLWQLGKWFTWEHGTVGDTRAKYAAELWRELMYPAYVRHLNGEGCGEGENLMLRQNPENPCQLEQSIDGGNTWSLAFDYSLCLPDFDDALLNAGVGTTTNNFYAPPSGGAYTSSNPALYPARRKALCLAAKLFAGVLLRLYADIRDGQITSILTGSAVLAIVSSILPLVVAVPIFVPFFIALSAAALAVYAIWLFSNPPFEPTDPEVVDALECAIVSHFQSRAVSEGNFASVFQGAQACKTGDVLSALRFGDAVVRSFRQTELFNAFVQMLGGAYENVQQGVNVADCCVDTGNWCMSWNHANFLQDWEFLSQTTGGIVNAAAIRTFSTVGNQFLNFRFRVQAYIPPETTITSLRVLAQKYNSTVNMAGSSYNQNDAANNSTFGVPAGLQWFTLNSGLPLSNGLWRPRFFYQTNAGPGQGIFDIFSIELRGTGQNPYGGRCDPC